MLCGSLRNRIHTWLPDYVRLQSLVVILLYAQIGCSLIGSLGPSYNGVLLMNLAIALFALVAIENSSQSLGRTYAILLFCAILLDISWLILFSREIWNISSEMYQALYIFSVKLTVAMEIAGFVVRLSSSLLWFQIYRLGASLVDTSLRRQSDSDLRNSFLEPPLLGRQCSREPDLRNSFFEPAAIAKQRSRSDGILGDSIDEPAYHTPPFDFDDGQNNNTSLKATQMQQPRQLNAPTPNLAAPADAGPLSNSSLESGQGTQQAQEQSGFTKQQLHDLKSQILAFRRLKKGEGSLPEELLQAIAPVGTQVQDRSSDKTVEDEARSLECGKESQAAAPSNGQKDHSRIKSPLSRSLDSLDSSLR